MSRLVLCSLVAAAVVGRSAAGEPPPCTLSVMPRVALAPLTTIHITTHVDEPAKVYTASLILLDSFGEIRRSQLWEGRDAAARVSRTLETDWKTLHLGDGAYEVQLVTSVRSCGARQHIEVGGSRP